MLAMTHPGPSISLSQRVPADSQPNLWYAALERRRQSGATLADLTEQNPTRVGLGGASAEYLAALADPAGSRYDPSAQGLPTARAAISAYYAGRGLEVQPADIVLVASTSEAYAHIFRLLCDPGDLLVVPAPSYPLFEVLAGLEGVRLDSYRLIFDGGWRVDLDSLEAALARGARIVVVVQPNHPTGSCLTAEEVARIEMACARVSASIISDEVFGDFLRSFEPVGPAKSLLDGSRAVTTFVLGGLSKLCGMPQLKLGWIVLSGPQANRDRARWGLEWISDTFLSVGTPVQLALPRLLEARHVFRDEILERIMTNWGVVEQSVQQAGLSLLPAEGGWAGVLRLANPSGAEQLAQELLEADIVIHPGYFYEFADDRHLVMSMISTPGAVAEAMTKMADRAGE